MHQTPIVWAESSLILFKKSGTVFFTIGTIHQPVQLFSPRFSNVCEASLDPIEIDRHLFCTWTQIDMQCQIVICERDNAGRQVTDAKVTTEKKLDPLQNPICKKTFRHNKDQSQAANRKTERRNDPNRSVSLQQGKCADRMNQGLLIHKKQLDLRISVEYRQYFSIIVRIDWNT